MFGIGSQELMVILLIVFILFCAKRLPEMGSSLVQAIRGFKKGMDSGADQLKPPEGQDPKGAK